VIEEGAANDSFFVVRDGTLDVFVGVDRRTTLGPGTFFGEISLERKTRTTASVVAQTPATLYVLGVSRIAIEC
jgi:CRP-like cAMP-binding protein